MLAALRVAEATGEGQHIEVPMFDSVLSTYTEARTALLEPADDRVMNPIYQAGPHGAVATAGTVQHVWRGLASHYPELEDPTPPGGDIATKGRLRRRAIEHWMAAQPTREALLNKLGAAGIACDPVVSLREALTGELASERELLVEVDDRRGSTRPVVRPPARFSASANRVRGPAPRQGEHNREILAELLGYDGVRIDALEREGVLRQSSPDER